LFRFGKERSVYLREEAFQREKRGLTADEGEKTLRNCPTRNKNSGRRGIKSPVRLEEKLFTFFLGGGVFSRSEKEMSCQVKERERLHLQKRGGTLSATEGGGGRGKEPPSGSRNTKEGGGGRSPRGKRGGGCRILHPGKTIRPSLRGNGSIFYDKRESKQQDKGEKDHPT